MKPTKPKGQKRSRKTKSAVVPATFSVFPSRLQTTLPYADQFNLQGTALSAVFGTERSFRLNSLYDPDFTSTGHQPYGFDQITPFYAKYLVHSVDVQVTFTDPGGDGLFVGAYVKAYDDTSTLTNASISQAIERPTVFCKALNDSGRQVVVYRKRINCWEALGLTKAQYDNNWQQTAASTAANPNIVPYFSIAVADANASSPALTCKVSIEMKFHCTFWERVFTAAQS